VLPLGDPGASTSLWGDGHRVIPGQPGRLQVAELPPGPYELRLYSADPNPTRTVFSIDGVDVGVIGGSQSDPNLALTHTLTVPINVPASGIVEIGFRGEGAFSFGSFNGAAFYVPEPGQAILIGVGLQWLAARRPRLRFSASSAGLRRKSAGRVPIRSGEDAAEPGPREPNRPGGGGRM
jgi:hypothetical protein